MESFHADIRLTLCETEASVETEAPANAEARRLVILGIASRFLLSPPVPRDLDRRPVPIEMDVNLLYHTR